MKIVVRVHSVENEEVLKLQSAIVVLPAVHLQIWLQVALPLSRNVFKPLFVYVDHSLIPVVHFDLQLLVSLLPFCETSARH